jgi:hypothetical protein
MILFTLICGYVLAQKGQVSEVISSYDDPQNNEKCKFVRKINAIENDTLSFVSIGS